MQDLLEAGKSRAAAILLLGLVALDTDGKCHFQVICKENTGTRSFVEMIHYLEFPTCSSASTYFDARRSAGSDRLQPCKLLVMTGGTYVHDR